jgi:hypothetical protein
LAVPASRGRDRSATLSGGATCRGAQGLNPARLTAGPSPRHLPR